MRPRSSPPRRRLGGASSCGFAFGRRGAGSAAGPAVAYHRRRIGRNALPDSFVVQLLDWMHDQGAAVTRGLEWLESYLQRWNLTTDAVLRRERQRQASNQISIGNCVTSLRLLSALDWPAFFERTSLVGGSFARRPRWSLFPARTFPPVIVIAVRWKNSRAAPKWTKSRSWTRPSASRRTAVQPPAPQNHIGYYLLGDGKGELQGLIRYRPAFQDRFLNFLLKHPQLVYFSGVTSVVLILLVILWACAVFMPSLWYGVPTALQPRFYPALVVLALLAAVLPASEIAVSLVNYWIGWLTPPRVLPKLLFKNGIPGDCATFVVMPTLLIRPRSAAALLERLEVHFLANPDPLLRFALLTDFADAPAEQMPEDEVYLQSALDGVRI